MALSCLKARAPRVVGLRPQRRTVLAIRAQGGSTTTVNFKIHRHVDYGQSLLIIGSAPELGSWDSKQAVELSWGEGDNWSTSLTFPAGVSVEYKYIIKRKDVLDWCPGQNKAVALPAAASVEVSDSWENNQKTVAVIAPAIEAPAAIEAPVEAPAPPSAVEEVPTAPVAEVDAAPVEAHMADNYISPAEMDMFTAVSTVENLHVPELEGAFQFPATQAAQHQQPPGFLANNIVQAVPMGAVAVSQDPIIQYEEADKYQVIEVGTGDKLVSAVATEARPVVQSMDSKTVSELRSDLKRRGMSSLGNRRELITRLQNAGAI